MPRACAFLGCRAIGLSTGCRIVDVAQEGRMVARLGQAPIRIAAGPRDETFRLGRVRAGCYLGGKYLRTPKLLVGDIGGCRASEFDCLLRYLDLELTGAAQIPCMHEQIDRREREATGDAAPPHGRIDHLRHVDLTYGVTCRRY